MYVFNIHTLNPQSKKKLLDSYELDLQMALYYGVSTSNEMLILKSKWIKYLHIKANILDLIEQKVGNIIERICIGDNFLKRIPMAQSLRSRINKWDLMKLKSFCKAIDTVIWTNRQTV